MRKPITTTVAAVLLVSVPVMLAACSGSEAGESTVASTAAVGDIDAVSDDDVFGDADDAPPESLVVVSYDPVAETGVPGIDSDDAFCRSWSEYAGSVQVISLSWLVQQPTQAAALEMAAGAALFAAVDGMSASLPSEIESNRQELTVDVPAPTLRRATRGTELLIEQGLTAEQIEELGATWLDAIRVAGLDDEGLTLDLESDVATAVAAAAEEFVAALPPFIDDPTLDTTAFDISPSLEYISNNCPDQGTLAGNDIIE